jgi:hypothetical protein
MEIFEFSSLQKYFGYKFQTCRPEQQAPNDTTSPTCHDIPHLPRHPPPATTSASSDATCCRRGSIGRRSRLSHSSTASNSEVLSRCSYNTASAAPRSTCSRKINVMNYSATCRPQANIGVRLVMRLDACRRFVTIAVRLVMRLVT